MKLKKWRGVDKKKAAYSKGCRLPLELDEKKLAKRLAKVRRGLEKRWKKLAAHCHHRSALLRPR